MAVDAAPTADAVSATRSGETQSRHRQCGSHGSDLSEISKIGWGGARANSGGVRAGAGRKPKPKAPTDGRVLASLQSIAVAPTVGARWYCVATFHRQELDVMGALTKQGFTAWLPRYERPTPDEPPRILALFPGYLFVRFDLTRDRWWRINGTAGVRKLFPIERERPVPVPPGVIEAWIARQGDDGLMPRTMLEKPTVRLVAGQMVKVTDGAFEGLAGMLQASTGTRVSVLLTLLGRETSASLPRSAIAPA